MKKYGGAPTGYPVGPLPPWLRPPVPTKIGYGRVPPSPKRQLSLLNTVRRGRHFETLAEDLLIKRGWRVLDRNFRFLRKEIDLVVEKDGLVAFVEVKGRGGPAFGHPLEAITRRKRHAISVAARAWIARSEFRARSYRFDAVSVRLMPDGSFELEHVEGAWTE